MTRPRTPLGFVAFSPRDDLSLAKACRTDEYEKSPTVPPAFELTITNRSSRELKRCIANVLREYCGSIFQDTANLRNVVNDETHYREGYHDRVRSEVLDLVPDGAQSILDVGGGIGSSVAYLKRAKGARHAVVVDLVADDCLPEVDAAYGGDLETPGLLDRISNEQGKFDAILCLDVLEHLTDPWAVVARCHEMLNPGGVIVASIPNMRHYSLVLPLVFKGRFDLENSGIRDRTHLRWFVKDTAIDLMTSSGLKLDHIEGNYYGRKNRRFDIATFGLARNFLYLQYFIRVKAS